MIITRRTFIVAVIIFILACYFWYNCGRSDEMVSEYSYLINKDGKEYLCKGSMSDVKITPCEALYSTPKPQVRVEALEGLETPVIELERIIVNSDKMILEAGTPPDVDGCVSIWREGDCLGVQISAADYKNRSIARIYVYGESDGSGKSLVYEGSIDLGVFTVKPAKQYTDVEIARAIWHIEGAAKASRPYGIMSIKCSSPEMYRLACLQTVKNNRERWIKAGCPGDFIDFLQKTYCPINAKNDPKGLNQFWAGNVRKYLGETE